MAKKIIVLNSSKPRISKVVAVLLVRRALADWVEEHVSIALRPIAELSKAAKFIPDRIPNEEFYYTKATLAPVDGTGCREKAFHPAPHRSQLISAARSFVQNPEMTRPLLEQTEFV